MSDISQLTLSKELQGSAGTAVGFMPEDTGDYVIVVGENGEFANGGGNVTVSQDGIAFDGLNNVTAATRKTVTCVGGRGILFTLGGGASGASIKCGVHKIGSRPRVISSSSSSSGT